MKKLYIVLVFCLLSFNTVYAETLIIKSVDKRVEEIEKAREKLDKDNQENYKQLQDQLKNISININTNQSKISAQEEYDYQLQVYELKSELACMDKEGYYSSFNKKTKQCECLEGSTFINGKCENTLRLRLDNLLMCVKNFGPLSHYDYDKAGCVCDEGSEFDSNQNGFCAVKEKPAGENRYIPVSERLQTPKEKIKTSTPIIPTIQVEDLSKAKITPNTSHDILSSIVPIQKKAIFWQKIKNGILKIKFWEKH